MEHRWNEIDRGKPIVSWLVMSTIISMVTIEILKSYPENLSYTGTPFVGYRYVVQKNEMTVTVRQ
jgi:hypothetical protein